MDIMVFLTVILVMLACIGLPVFQKRLRVKQSQKFKGQGELNQHQEIK